MEAAAKRLKESEKRIEQYLVKRIREAGGKAYKFESPGSAGVPDRIVVREGHTWFVELKSSTGRPTDLQKKRIRELALLGVDVTILGSHSDVDTFIRCIDCRYSMISFRLHQAKKYDLLTTDDKTNRALIGLRKAGDENEI